MTTTTPTSTSVFQHTAGKGWSAPMPRLDSDKTLVLAFGAPEYRDNTTPFSELRAAFPSSHIVGCSTSGEIFGPRIFDGTIAVAVKRFQHTTLATASAPVRTAADSFRAGASLAEQLTRPGLKGILILSDGLNVNGTELVRGLNSVLPEGVIITGGLAGDGARFQKTWVLRNAEPESGIVSAVAFYGDRVRIGHGSKGGYSCFGPERTITRSRGNVLLELDGNPALDLYKKYLGERSKDLPASGLLFPLAIRPTRESDHTLVRTILGISEQENSMTFAGDIPQGWCAQLMRANFDWLIDAAADSALDSCDPSTPSPEQLTIAVSCVGRRLIMGERTEEELDAARSALPADGQLVGFYSYGELSPHARGKCCELHNQTMTVTSIKEV